MITEHQQEQAGLYALGVLPEAERRAFENELRANAELLALVHSLQRAADAIALSAPRAELPAGLKAKVMQQVESVAGMPAKARPPGPDALAAAGLSFLMAADSSGWKALPIPGAYLKLLSIERERGYALLLGKLDPGTRYPAHVNVGPEDFYILTGDLHIGDTELRAGDFHHAEGGSQHAENVSVAGCTLLAVLSTDDPLVAFAMS